MNKISMETRDQWYKPNLLYNIHWRPPKEPGTPKMIVETVQFNPSLCTCGQHDSQPRYRMERRVLWSNKERPSFNQKIKQKDGLGKLDTYKSERNNSKLGDVKDVSQDEGVAKAQMENYKGCTDVGLKAEGGSNNSDGSYSGSAEQDGYGENSGDECDGENVDDWNKDGKKHCDGKNLRGSKSSCVERTGHEEIYKSCSDVEDDENDNGLMRDGKTDGHSETVDSSKYTGNCVEKTGHGETCEHNFDDKNGECGNSLKLVGKKNTYVNDSISGIHIGNEGNEINVCVCDIIADGGVCDRATEDVDRYNGNDTGDTDGGVCDRATEDVDRYNGNDTGETDDGVCDRANEDVDRYNGNDTGETDDGVCDRATEDVDRYNGNDTGETDDGVCDRATEDVDRYSGNDTGNRYENLSVRQEKYEDYDVDISPAFGIMSIYCNSELHRNVTSAHRPNIT